MRVPGEKLATGTLSGYKGTDMSRSICFVALALMVVGVACSSNESSLVAPSGSAPVVTAAPTVLGTATFAAPNFTFVLNQHNANGKFSFDPSTINAPKGSTATIELTNAGSVKHNLTIKPLNVNQDLDPGKSMTLVVKLGTAAQVPFYCEYHKASGMTGTFDLT